MGVWQGDFPKGIQHLHRLSNFVQDFNYEFWVQSFDVKCCWMAMATLRPGYSPFMFQLTLR